MFYDRNKLHTYPKLIFIMCTHVLQLTEHFVDIMMYLCFVGDYRVCLQITGGRCQAKEAFCSCKWIKLECLIR